MADYRVEVKIRARRPTPYNWEIYRSNDQMLIEQSMDGYGSRREALEAGQTALLRILDNDALNLSLIHI